MGFGLLLIGYTTAFLFSYNPYGYAAQLLGFAVMFAASRPLALYIKKFRAVQPILAALFACSILFMLDRTGAAAVADGVRVLAERIFTVLVFALHIFVLLGINDIAVQTKLPKIRQRSLRNCFYGVLYFALTLFGELPTPVRDEYKKYFGVPVLVLGLGWFVLNIILIFSAYRFICLEGDEDMPRKQSRFEIINRINKEIDDAEIKRAKEREQRSQERKNSRGKRRK